MYTQTGVPLVYASYMYWKMLAYLNVISMRNYRPQGKSFLSHRVSPLEGNHLVRDPLDNCPTWTDLPWTDSLDRDLPWTETFLDKDPLNRLPGQRPPLDRDLPWTETSPAQRPPLHRDLPCTETSPAQRPLHSTGMHSYFKLFLTVYVPFKIE